MNGKHKGITKAPAGDSLTKVQPPVADTVTSLSLEFAGGSSTHTPDQFRDPLDTLSGSLSSQTAATLALQGSRGNRFTSAVLCGACQCAECSDGDRSPSAHDFKIGSPVGSGSVAASSLNVRKGPGTNYKTGASLSKGSKVTIYGRVSDWLCIGDGQWVSARFIASSKVGADAPGPDLTSIVKNVWYAMFGGSGIGTDEDAVYSSLALLNHDPVLIARFEKLYRATHGTRVTADIESEFSNLFGNELDRALSYLAATPKKAATQQETSPQKLAPVKPKAATSPATTRAKKVAAFYASYYAMAQKSEKETGVPALVILGQAALESGWGANAPGNMFFGVKASASDPPETRQLLRTGEVLSTADKKFPEVISVTQRDDGKYDYVVRAWFRKYPSAADSFADHGRFLRKNANYKPAFEHQDDPYAFADAIAAARYATAPNYAKSLKAVMRDIESAGSVGSAKPESKPVSNAPSGGLGATMIETLLRDLQRAISGAVQQPAAGSVVADLRTRIEAGKIIFDSPSHKAEILGENKGTKVSPLLQKLICEISALQSVIRISSVVRNEGHHGAGRAVDIGNETIAKELLPRIATDARVRELAIDELIFDASVAGQEDRNLWNYDQGKKHNYGSGTLNDHKNHIHFAVKSS